MLPLPEITFDEEECVRVRELCTARLDDLDDDRLRAQCAAAGPFYPDAKDIPAVVDRLIAALQQREPFSLVRVGDGEGNILRLSPTYGTPPEPVEVKCFDQAFRSQNAVLFPQEMADKIAFAEKMAVAIRNASIVGFRGTWTGIRCERTMILKLLETGDVRGALGILHARLFAQELIRQPVPGRVGITYAHCYFALLEELKRMLDSAQKVIVVTGNPGLRPVFRRVLENRLIEFSLIPTQGARGHKDLNEAQIEESSSRVLNTLSQPLQGVLVLVGAGLFGKFCCETVRRAGGVAVDIGSGLDLLAGRRTRPVHQNYSGFVPKW